jgi:hypothetical protein
MVIAPRRAQRNSAETDFRLSPVGVRRSIDRSKKAGFKMSEMSAEVTSYHHTQKGPWCLLMYAVAAVFLTVSWYQQEVPPLAVTFGLTGGLMFMLGTSFQTLTVADEGSRLALRFGPFPLFRKRIWYEDIVEVAKGRTTFLDGWGIHLSVRGGWVWNIWGFHCVVLKLKRGTLRIGTDDPDGLHDFLMSRISKAG